MIISKTPLRMSFVGGGSDIPSFYRKFGGAVLSTSVDKFVYVTVNQKFDDAIRVSYSRTEEVESVDAVQHPLVREALRKCGIVGGLEITSIADIPSRGTGLGSSSAFSVGLLHALYAFQGRYVSSDRLAAESCEIEIERCGEPIGKQDQYASAYGGLNFVEFFPDDSVAVSPVICRRETIDQLDRNCLVFFTGRTRSASALLARQIESVQASTEKQAALRAMVKLAHDLRRELQNDRLDNFGAILHENWELKRSLTGGVSNAAIDGWYERARQAGGEGGKLLGAGEGGFLLVYAPAEKHDSVRRSLADLREVRLGFDRTGSRIIFCH